MNKNISMFCLTLNPNHLKLIKKINYIPVGLGNKIFSDEFILDNKGKNISNKNKFYGEYTFHYFLWKNHLEKINDNWIGFCQYRKFWTNTKSTTIDNNFENFDNIILKKIPVEYEAYESILAEPMFINQFRFTKFIKRNLKEMIKKPSLFINKKNRNIRFHFDMWHGKGNLEKAINLLDEKEKIDFKEFVDNEVSFNPQNMFICKSKKLLIAYYESVFPWLKRCENIFGFNNLDSYGLQRIYGFLAERYLSYWFKKYSKFKTMSILFKDLSDF
ncbi:MAG: DUF4422 domain-containing protein [Pelagibacteraceae bacterium]